MVETYTQLKDRLYAKRGGICEVCKADVPRGTIDEQDMSGRPPIQAHHVLHRNVGPHMKMDEDNIVLLCKTCHELDYTGALRPLLIRQKGQEWFDNLRAKGAARGDSKTG